MYMTDGFTTEEISWDTEKNYIVLEDLIERLEPSPVEVLQLFANEYGLQLFSEEHTASLLQDFGFEEE
jgi:hypothetical protein